jgi:uncharacterized membrane protein (GlpM family)
MYLLLKGVISGLIIVAVSELARKYSFFSALIASLPLTSILAFIWIYTDTKDADTIGRLSHEIFWLVIPSLTLFLLLPMLLKMKLSFYAALFLAILGTLIAYGVLLALKSWLI